MHTLRFPSPTLTAARPLAIVRPTLAHELAAVRRAAFETILQDNTPTPVLFDWLRDDPEMALDAAAGQDCHVATNPAGVPRRLWIARGGC